MKNIKATEPITIAAIEPFEILLNDEASINKLSEIAVYKLNVP